MVTSHAWSSSYVPQKAIVTLSDTSSPHDLAELRWRLHDLVLDGVREVVIDISDVDGLSSTTLAALLATHRVCRQRGGGVVIRYPDRSTLGMLRRTGLDRVFRVERPSFDQPS